MIADGTARLTLVTHRFGLSEHLDEDGSAVIVHAATENFGNLPSERYDPDPDEATLNTGDAGGRVECGVVVEATS
jgi:superoxide dismutase, Cu-Zn family